MGRPARLDRAAIATDAVPGLAFVRAVAEATRRRLVEEWTGGRPYRLSLTLPRANGFAAGPRDFRPTDAEAGRRLLAGRFILAGATMELEPGSDPWDRPSPSRLFAVRLHRFAWSPDLLGTGEAGARELLRLFLAWRAVFDRIDPFGWGPETLERRVFNLACAARRLSAVASDAEVQMLAASLAVQARHLMRLEPAPARAAERLCAAATAGAALAGPAGEQLLARSLPRLSKALVLAVLPDGGLKTRSPEAGLELLLDLLTLDDALLQRGREAPVEVARAIDRLTGALRFFTLGDGRLPAFHGGEAGDPGHVDAARTHEESDAKAFGYAPHSGYHRLMGRTLVAIVDAAPPPTGPWSVTACAHPLSIEVAAGRDRLIVNSGWSPDAAAPQGLRLTAGGSTASLADESAGRPLTGFLARGLGARLVGGPSRVDARRNENEGGVWLELAHDGWAAGFGLLHERRLFLDPKADELRGEDRFALAAHGPRQGVRETAYAVRFHLHPDVQVSLARDQRSVLLRGVSDRGWWFRNDAAEATLEPSVWFDHGLPRRTVQIVLRGAVSSAEGAQVRWKLTPVDSEPPAKR
ncbi:MAG TPA: heparinase II/III family protein [Caulobacteraceae bacterium]|nr:heparinase II/III family protein [Caulobacteraceae bacterium]